MNEPFMRLPSMSLPYAAAGAALALLALLLTLAPAADAQFWAKQAGQNNQGAVATSPQPPADAPVTQWLRHELEKVRAQSGLKRGRLWSVLPFWIGAVVFTWGLDTSLSSRIFFSAVLTGMNLVIYVTMWKLNQYTWRKADQPLIEELETLLKSNNPES